MQVSGERAVYASCVYFSAACGRVVVVAPASGVCLAEQRALQDAAVECVHAVSARILRPEWCRADRVNKRARCPSECARPAELRSCGFGSGAVVDKGARACASRHKSLLQSVRPPAAAHCHQHASQRSQTRLFLVHARLSSRAPLLPIRQRILFPRIWGNTYRVYKFKSSNSFCMPCCQGFYFKRKFRVELSRCPFHIGGDFDAFRLAALGTADLAD